MDTSGKWIWTASIIFIIAITIILILDKNGVFNKYNRNKDVRIIYVNCNKNDLNENNQRNINK